MNTRTKTVLFILTGLALCWAEGYRLIAPPNAIADTPARGEDAHVASPRDVLRSFGPPDAADDEPTSEPAQDEVEAAPTLRKLTPEEINRIRFLELRGMRLTTDRPDRVVVKISRETSQQFLRDLEGHADFQGEKSRRAFWKLTAPQKLHYMAQYKGAAYADRVEIKSDPEVFVKFRKNVMPTVLRGCAASGCHNAMNDSERVPFKLFKDPKRTAATTYANFIVLNDVTHDHHRLIDRAQPEDSLLLTYMLPDTEVRPEFRHPADITPKPMFQSRRAAGLRRIQAWVASLKHPQEDYGVHLVPPKDRAESQPDQTEGQTAAPASRPEPGSQEKESQR